MPNYCDVITKMWQSCVKIRAQSPACLRSHDKTFGYLLLPGKPIADRSAHRKGSQSSQWEFYLEQKEEQIRFHANYYMYVDESSQNIKHWQKG
jgi:hypothetical protein